MESGKVGNIDAEMKKTLKWKPVNEKNITLPKEAAGNRGTHREQGARRKMGVTSPNSPPHPTPHPHPAQSPQMRDVRAQEKPGGRSLDTKATPILKDSCPG